MEWRELNDGGNEEDARLDIEYAYKPLPSSTDEGFVSNNNKTMTNTFAQNIHNKLDSNRLCLLRNEEILLSWKHDTSKISIRERYATFVTLGLYWLYTRVFLRRHRIYSVYITNYRVIVKEEMFESRGLCCLVENFVENQASYDLSNFKYACVEQLAPRWCGLIPMSGVLELHFICAPNWSALPQVSYEVNVLWIFYKVFFQAFQAVYGVDLGEKGNVKLQQAAANRGKFIQPHLIYLFILQLFIELGKEVYRLLFLFISFFFADPIVGSRQVSGDIDARIFRWEVDVHQDPDYISNFQSILKVLASQIPHCGNIPESAEGLNTINVLNNFDHLMPLNNRRSTQSNSNHTSNSSSRSSGGSDCGYTYYNNILPLTTNERIVDVAADNPRFTWNELAMVSLSCGLYYCTNVFSKMRFWTTNYYLTDHRLIRKQLVVSSDKTMIKYYRVEFYTLTECMSASIEYEKMPWLGVYPVDAHSFTAGGPMLGLEIKCQDFEFGCKLVKYLMSKRPISMQSISSLPVERYNSNQVPFLTKNLLVSYETIESMLCAHPKIADIDICCTCGCYTEDKYAITVTNLGIYLENHSSNMWSDHADYIKGNGRNLVFLSWSNISGCYWSNFKHTNPCSCCEPTGCINTGTIEEYFNCCWCLNLCCNPGDRMYPPHGYIGSQVRVNLSDNTFGFGLCKFSVFFDKKNVYLTLQYVTKFIKMLF